MDKLDHFATALNMVQKSCSPRENLIDPGDCSHPPDRQHYNGIQYGLNNEPLLRLHTCLDCGATLAEKIEG